MKPRLKLTILLLCAIVVAGCSSASRTKNKNVVHNEATPPHIMRQLPHKITPEVRKFFNDMKMTGDKSYAYTAGNPVCIFDGNVRTSVNKVYYYIANLRDGNGDLMNYLGRHSMPNPAHTENGGTSACPFLDVYSYVNGKDTLRIHVNMYEKGLLAIPAGLTFAGE